MNSGGIFGVVRRSGQPVEGAIVGLDWISGGGGRLPIYNTSGDGPVDRLRSIRRRGVMTDMPRELTNAYAVTTDEGGFSIAFQWSGTDVGAAVQNMRCQVFVLVPTALENDNVAMRNMGRYTTPVISTVSLGQVASGMIPNPTQLGDAIGLGADIFVALRSLRRPMIGVTIAPPSPDMYALIAGFRITL